MATEHTENTEITIHVGWASAHRSKLSRVGCALHTDALEIGKVSPDKVRHNRGKISTRSESVMQELQ